MSLKNFKLTYEVLEDEKKIWRTKTRAKNTQRPIRTRIQFREIFGLLRKRTADRGSTNRTERVK